MSHIMSLAKRYFPDRYKDLILVDMEQENPELFGTLRKTWIHWLDWDKQPELWQDPTSLDIAKYLFRAGERNEKFKARMWTLISEDKIEETKDNYPNYYGLIEVACRLNDLLKWVTVQWWADRQNLYDDIIKTIVGSGWNIKKFPELKNLQDLCKSKLWEEKRFSRIYLYKDRYNKSLRENEKKLSHRNKYRKITSLTSLALLLLLWWAIGWYHLSNQIHKKKQEEKNKQLLKETLLNRYSQKAYFDAWERGTVLGLELRISEATENMYDDFVQIYWSWDNTNKEKLDMLKRLMKQYFLESDSNGALVNIDSVYRSFLVPERLHKVLKIFVSKYSQFLSESWFNIVPRPQMWRNYDACKYTNELRWDVVARYIENAWSQWQNLVIQSDSTTYKKEFDKYILDRKKDYIFSTSPLPEYTYRCRRYGHYLCCDGKDYDVLILTADDDKSFLVAYEREIGDTKFDMTKYHEYTKKNGEKISKDFLENRYITGKSFEDN